MRNSPVWFILAGLMLILDFYVFQVVKMLSQSAGSRTKTIIYVSYWTISAIALIVLFILPLFIDFPRSVRSVIMAVFIGLSTHNQAA